MTELSEAMAIGLFVGPKTDATQAFRKWPDTISALHAEGAEPYLVNEHTVVVDGVWEIATRLSDCPEGARAVTRQPIDALRDYTGRMGNITDVPRLNEPAVLNLVQDKGNFHMAFGDVTAQTLVVRGESDRSSIGDFLHALPGAEAVLKPITSVGGKETLIGSKQEIAALAAARTEGDFLIQQCLDTSSIDPAIRGINPAACERMARAANAQELRLFCFGDARLPMVPILRCGTEGRVMGGGDSYVYIDPASVPEVAYNLGRHVTERIMQQTAAKGLFMALDITWSEGDGWHVLEGNVKQPSTVQRKHNAYIAGILHRSLARHLMVLAAA